MTEPIFFTFRKSILDPLNIKCTNKNCDRTDYIRTLLAATMFESREVLDKFCEEHDLNLNWLEQLPPPKTAEEQKKFPMHSKMEFKMGRKVPTDRISVRLEQELIDYLKNLEDTSTGSKSYWLQYFVLKDIATPDLALMFRVNLNHEERAKWDKVNNTGYKTRHMYGLIT